MTIILDRFFGEEETRRPDLIWENLEDMIYHDTYYHDGRLDDSFELCAFLHRVWTFNRAMRWRQSDHGLIAQTVGGPLMLTGEDAVSDWHTGSRNEIDASGNELRWSQGSHKRRDGLVLPTFQFHLGQHPRLRIDVKEAKGTWQAVVALKGRSGAPLWSSGWSEGAGTVTVPVEELLSARGYDLQFAEVHVAVGTWNDDPAAGGMLGFEATLEPEPALVAALPTIRTEESAATAGVPIVVAALDSGGAPVDPGSVKVSASGPVDVPDLEFDDGIWSAVVPSLGPGDHRFDVEVDGALRVRRQIVLRVTREAETIERPLSGSYHGSVFVVSPGEQDEALVEGQRQWDKLVVEQRQGWDRLHYWDALTEPELRERFGYLRGCGWDLLHLHSHWAMWARFDAGGHLSPRIAEQAALFYRTASAAGLQVIQTLADYPYGVMREPGVMPDLAAPWKAYMDRGFEDEEWFDPESTFAELYANYLAEYVSVFREETALYALTQSGEADHVAGPARVNATERILRGLGDRHRYLVQPVLRTTDLPETFSEGYEQELQGARTYSVAEVVPPHWDLGVELKVMQMANWVIAESSFAMTNMYFRLHEGLEDDRGTHWSWTGTQHYRLRLRDTLYLALVHDIGLVLTWDEQIAEDEHRVFSEVAELAPWTVGGVRSASVVVPIDGEMLAGHRRRHLGDCERWFATNGYRYRLVPATESTATSGRALDITDGFRDADARRLVDSRQVKVSAGYACSWTEMSDGGAFAGYFYNASRTIEQRYWMCGLLHRVPMPAALELRLPDGHEAGELSVFDLTSKKQVDDFGRRKDGTLAFGPTTHDYFVVSKNQ